MGEQQIQSWYDQSRRLSQTPQSSDLPALPDREQWLGLSTAPGFEYWGCWIYMGPAEMAAMVQAHREQKALGYLPPVVFAHDWQAHPKRLGEVVDLRAWFGAMGQQSPRLWLLAHVRWTAEAWLDVKSNAIQWISPHYCPGSDSQGQEWPLNLLEVSATPIPRQLHIQSVQTWARKSGHQLGRPAGANVTEDTMKNRAQRLALLATLLTQGQTAQQMAQLRLSLDQSLDQLKKRPTFSATLADAPQDVLAIIQKDVADLGSKVSECLGMIATERARLDVLAQQVQDLLSEPETEPSPGTEPAPETDLAQAQRRADVALAMAKAGGSLTLTLTADQVAVLSAVPSATLKALLALAQPAPSGAPASSPAAPPVPALPPGAGQRHSMGAPPAPALPGLPPSPSTDPDKLRQQLFDQATTDAKKLGKPHHAVFQQLLSQHGLR